MRRPNAKWLYQLAVDEIRQGYEKLGPLLGQNFKVVDLYTHTRPDTPLVYFRPPNLITISVMATYPAEKEARRLLRDAIASYGSWCMHEVDKHEFNIAPKGHKLPKPRMPFFRDPQWLTCRERLDL